MPSAIGSMVVNGVTIEVVERGEGRPILFLHPGIGIEPDAPVLTALAKGGRVIAPSHPGFGTSELPKGMNTVDDLAYFYLDLLDQLDLHDVLMVGVGLGGWIAAELAIKNSTRLSRLVMANAIGVKIGGRETRAQRLWVKTGMEPHSHAHGMEHVYAGETLFYRELADKYGLPTQYVAAQMSAYSAAKILVEALKRAGKDLNREKLIQALEGLYEYQTGFTPAVTYGPNRRIGAMGAYVVTIDLKKKEFAPASGWISVS